MFLVVAHAPKSEHDICENEKDYTGRSCSAFAFANKKLVCRTTNGYSLHFRFKR